MTSITRGYRKLQSIYIHKRMEKQKCSCKTSSLGTKLAVPSQQQ